MGKCVDLPPDNLCQLNADIFSGRQIIIQLNADIFSGHQIIYVSLMLTDFLEPLTNLFLLQAQHQHNQCANAEPKTIRNNFWFMQQQILLLKKRFDEVEELLSEPMTQHWELKLPVAVSS